MSSSISAKFNALNKRERVLLSFTLSIVIIVLFFILAFEPLMKKSSKLASSIEQKELRLSGYDVEINAFTHALNMDPSAPLRDEVKNLENVDRQLTALLKQRSVYLMDPMKMSGVLETVLEEKQGITLQRLSSLPLEPLQLSSEKDDNADDSLNAHVYSHGFEVVLRGGYSDIYDYLLRLESLSSSFFWGSLDFKVSEFPESEVTLRVHTLSVVEGWLGG